MNTKNVNHFAWLATGMAACLATSSCMTVCDTQTRTTERGHPRPQVSANLADKDVRTPLTDGQMVRQKMKNIILPEVVIRPPATLVDAIDFLRSASKDYDDHQIPVDQRGVNLILKLPSAFNVDSDDPFATTVGATNNIPVMPAISVRNISLYDALKLVCEATNMRIRVTDNVVMIVPLFDPMDSEFLSRSYYVIPSFVDRAFAIERELSSDVLNPWLEGAWGTTEEDDLKSLFTQLGVSWPTGTSITYALGRLRVRNTEDNLAVIEQILEEVNCFPCLINVDVQVVSFRAKDIAKLRLAGGMTKEALRGLQKAGKAKVMAEASAVVIQDGEAMVKATQEIIYPSEIGRGEGTTVEPQNFTMREIGMILQILPKVSFYEPLIHLILRPQWVTLDRWESYPAALATGWRSRTVPFRQPVFSVTSFETQVMLADGDTILLGSSSTTDGKWVNVGFLTAKKMRVESR